MNDFADSRVFGMLIVYRFADGIVHELIRPDSLLELARLNRVPNLNDEFASYRILTNFVKVRENFAHHMQYKTSICLLGFNTMFLVQLVYLMSHIREQFLYEHNRNTD